MYSKSASLEIHSPDGNISTLQIEREYLTIGRSDQNDLVLQDPENNISRCHCALEYKDKRWWVLDTRPSANGTYLQLNQSPKVKSDVRQYKKLPLEDQDKILIPAKLLRTETPLYYTIIFLDHERTNRIPFFQPPELKYSPSRRKLCRISGGTSEEIQLPPKALDLVNYMATKENSVNNLPSVCSTIELNEEIYSYADPNDNSRITHLVCEVRKKIELNRKEPEFLITEGNGYSLRVTLQD